MFGSWSINRIAWSLRKARLPIKPSDVVLDVGSGSSPHPAADVLLERYLDPRHRYSAMVIDRPTVLADACKTPFKDKAFDFVIAFHVLEHVPDPAAFLNELQRIGKAGYIETPNAIFERLVPYDVHLSEVMDVGGKLVINKKSSARPDQFLNELDLIKQSKGWNSFFYGKPKLFHVRYFWKDKIDFKVINPEVSSDWFVEPAELPPDPDKFATSNGERSLRSTGLKALRSWNRMKKKKQIDLASLLVCPECHQRIVVDDERAVCERCKTTYPMRPVPDFNNPTRNVENDSLRRSA